MGGPGVLFGRFQSSDSRNRRRLYFINKRISDENHCNEGNIFLSFLLRTNIPFDFLKNRTILSAAFFQTQVFFSG